MNYGNTNKSMNQHRLKDADQIWGYIFVAPQILGILFFTLIPILFAIALAFCEWNLLKPPMFVGFTNFQKVFRNKTFWDVLGNTGYYVLLYIPGVTVISLTLAILMNQTFRGISILRTLFYLPHLTCSVAVCLVWSFIYQRNGLLNAILSVFGIPPQKWLTNPDLAMPSVVIVCIWRAMGHQMVLYLAGLKGINPTYYEAARIDGAGPFHLLFNITLPLLTPTVFFTLCTNLIGSAQVFNEVYMLTGGGPGRSTQTMVYQIYTLAFEKMSMGRSAVWALSLFIIIMIITAIQFLFQKYWVNYDA